MIQMFGSKLNFDWRILLLSSLIMILNKDKVNALSLQKVQNLFLHFYI